MLAWLVEHPRSKQQALRCCHLKPDVQIAAMQVERLEQAPQPIIAGPTPAPQQILVRQRMVQGFPALGFICSSPHMLSEVKSTILEDVAAQVQVLGTTLDLCSVCPLYESKGRGCNE